MPVLVCQIGRGKARRSIKSVTVVHKGSWGRMCFLRAERRRKIHKLHSIFIMVKVSALLLLIAFVANPLLDQLYSLFSVSEHPMQAGSTVQSLKNFCVCVPGVCVCVWGGGGGGGEAPLPPLYPPLIYIPSFNTLSKDFYHLCFNFLSRILPHRTRMIPQRMMTSKRRIPIAAPE